MIAEYVGSGAQCEAMVADKHPMADKPPHRTLPSKLIHHKNFLAIHLTMSKTVKPTNAMIQYSWFLFAVTTSQGYSYRVLRTVPWHDSAFLRRAELDAIIGTTGHFRLIAPRWARGRRAIIDTGLDEQKGAQ